MSVINCELQIVDRKPSVFIPKKSDFHKWLEAVLLSRSTGKKEITIRLVDKIESQILNFRYRNKNQPTNILSFSFFNQHQPFFKKNTTKSLLGDLVICSTLIEEEAREQQKSLKSHWAHIVIHGTLHLLGYNHQNNNDAKHMELIETNIMLALGYLDPYVIM
ncbi:MAG: rRNA maturation RNase YbeY [Candidatus Dasytiphilus stammeri]